MTNETHVISGHQELPEVSYTKNSDFIEAVSDYTDSKLEAWHRWPKVKNTWSFTLTSIGSGLKTRYTRYHDTDICYEFNGLLYLTPQGFYTNTTMRRLNVVIDAFCEWRVCHIYQDKNQWWMQAAYNNGTKCHQLPFEEGMRLNADSELVDYYQPAPRLDRDLNSQGVLLDAELMP